MKKSFMGAFKKPGGNYISIILFMTIILGTMPVLANTIKWKTKVWGEASYSLALGSDETIYVVTNYPGGPQRTNLNALNANGTIKWVLDESWQFRGTPTIAPDGTIYLRSYAKKMYALDPSGKKDWEFPTCSDNLTDMALDSDGTIYFAAGSSNDNDGTGMVYAVNPDGSEKWTYTISDVYYIKTSPAIGPDGTIYIMINKVGEGQLLHALNPDGSTKWIAQEENLSVITKNLAIGVDGIIYAGGYKGLLAINPEDGSIKWQTFTNDSYSTTSPVIDSQGTIYIGSKDHNLYAVNPDGTIKWKFQTGRKVYSTPTIASDGTIYFSSWDHNLYAVSQGGHLKWSCDIESAAISAPVIGSDGTIYTVQYSTGGRYYVIAINGDGNTLATDSPWPTIGRNFQHTANIREFVPLPISPINYQVDQGPSVLFNWEKTGEDSTYIFQLANNPGFLQPFSRKGRETDISLSGFTQGNQFFWRVAIESAFTDPVFSKPQTFVYQNPLTHALIFAPDFGALVKNPVNLSWGFPGAAEFALQIATDPEYTQFKFSGYVAGTGVNITCDPDTTYYWRVGPVDADRVFIGSWSHSYQFTTIAQ
ncbi:MAG: PQQ-like beta-propeller repeat protein [Desulfobacteraceae bacterium]|nr:PQQ-like beta-propeller repeat protein [Desulfobacteraceae bacterium]